MKIRLGFVSNSSSTGFICWGFRSTEPMLLKMGNIDPNDEDAVDEFLYDEGYVEIFRSQGFPDIYCITDNASDKMYLGVCLDISNEAAADSVDGLKLKNMMEQVERFGKAFGIIQEAKLWYGSRSY